MATVLVGAIFVTPENQYNIEPYVGGYVKLIP